jgi:hypothetical protein
LPSVAKYILTQSTAAAGFPQAVEGEHVHECILIELENLDVGAVFAGRARIFNVNVF